MNDSQKHSDKSPVPRSVRFSLGVGVPLVAGVLSLGPILLWRKDVPSQLASHWSGLGRPDGYTSRGSMILWIIAIFFVGSAVLAATAFRKHPTVDASLGGGVLGGLLCGLTSIVSVVTFLINRHANSSRGASPSLTFPMLVIPLAMLAAFLVATGILASSLAIGRPLPVAATPITTEAGERVAWTGTGRPKPVLTAMQAGAFVVPIVIGLATGKWGASMFSIVIGGVSLLMSGVRVSVGPTGMRASMGVFGLPHVNLSIDQMVQASALDIRPSKWGGWGYRGSLKLFKRAAMILRAGEGIRVDLIGGLVFVVSVDDAEVGASVLQAAIAAKQ